ncbi:unnamed protein product [Arctia plantaginis]|uniref:Uncharacterized protein n=1 Tax=Arctia plantaginis TaxID=874455 RepID=A0A8S0YZL5_ARCPL|nr:unnamed protein product [Arctia plantaginis]
MTTWRILWLDLGLHPYKIVLAQELKPSDHCISREFADYALEMMEADDDFHRKIIFSDEAHFWLNGFVNKQNCRYWSESNPRVVHESPLHPQKTTVWCGLWYGGIIGPYCFESDEGNPVTVNISCRNLMILMQTTFIFNKTVHHLTLLRVNMELLRGKFAANVYINDCISQPPPPPPPLPPPNVLQAAGAQQPPPLPTPLPSLLAPPPPPPPPPTISTASILATPVFTGPHQVSSTAGTVFPIPETMSTIKFDASKPPPPLPSCKNGTIKRPAEPAEALPNKRRKLQVEHSLCEACIQRELRIEVFQKEIEKLECERECQSFLLQKKSETFANLKLLLKSAVGPDLFQIMNAYIEQATSPLEQVNDVMSHISQMNSLVSGPSSSSSLQNQIMNIMDLARNIVEGPRSNTFASNQERTKQSFIEMLRNASSSSQKPSSSIPTSAHIPNRTQSVVEPHKRTYTQKRMHAQNVPHSLVAVQARNVQNGTSQQIASPLVQNITHQPSVTYPQNASQNAITPNTTHLQNAVQPPNTFATMPLRPTQRPNLRQQNSVPPQVAMPPIYPGIGEYQTAAPPPPRPYCPPYAGVCNNGGVGYNAPIRGASASAVVPTTGTPPQYAYLPQYPHHQ